MTTNTVAIAKMDWTGVSAEVKSKLTYYSRSIQSQTKKATKEFLDLCELVFLAHKELAGIGQEGKFSQWIKSECNFSISSAYRYIDVYRTFGTGKLPTVGSFVGDLSHLNPAAMIELSQSNTPPEVLSAAVESETPVTKSDVVKAKETARKAKAELVIPMEDATIVESTDDDQSDQYEDVPDEEDEAVEESEPETKPDPPKKLPKPGSETLSPAKVIDEFYRAHFSPLVRGLDRASDAIGKKGPNYRKADDALNAFSSAVKEMREGKA